MLPAVTGSTVCWAGVVGHWAVLSYNTAQYPIYLGTTSINVTIDAAASITYLVRTERPPPGLGPANIHRTQIEEILPHMATLDTSTQQHNQGASNRSFHKQQKLGSIKDPPAPFFSWGGLNFSFYQNLFCSDNFQEGAIWLYAGGSPSLVYLFWCFRCVLDILCACL